MQPSDDTKRYLQLHCIRDASRVTSLRLPQLTRIGSVGPGRGRGTRRGGRSARESENFSFKNHFDESRRSAAGRHGSRRIQVPGPRPGKGRGPRAPARAGTGVSGPKPDLRAGTGVSGSGPGRAGKGRPLPASEGAAGPRASEAAAITTAAAGERAAAASPAIVDRQ